MTIIIIIIIMIMIIIIIIIIIIIRYGLDIAKKIRIFELETVLALKKLIKDHGWEKKVELREGGTVHSYLTDLEFNEAIENIEEMRNQGLGHELLIWDRLETVKVYNIQI